MSHLTEKTKNFPNVPSYYADHPSLLKKMILVVQNTMRGKTNNTYTVTLTPNSATTTVTLPQDSFGLNSVFHFMPTTSEAATEFGAGTMYVSTRDPDHNQFIITHANNGDTLRTFAYTITG